MALVFLLSSVLLTTLSPVSGSPARGHNTDSCLPTGIQSTSVVSTEALKTGKAMTVTVAQKLKQMRARCRRGKLVDAAGKEIRFYQLVGCWGNPPDDYQEQLERQAQELAKLRKRYRVIEMTCNVAGDDMLRVTPPPD